MNEKQKVIYEIQDYLRNISYYNENVPFVASDGIFGDETTEAVKIFQQEYDLEESGRVDFETWKKLTEVSALATQQIISPFSAPSEVKAALPLKIGDEGIFVHQLKLMLRHLSENFSNFSLPSDYEVFDEETEKQIKRWQRISALPESGQSDILTWNSLAAFYLL